MKSQQEKFQEAFYKLIENEEKFKNNSDGKLKFTVDGVKPFIEGEKYLSDKGKNKLTALVNKFKSHSF